MNDLKNLVVTREDGVSLVTFNRPQALNALNQETLRELDGVIKSLGADDETACLILTGAGEKAFVAGADIKELAELDPTTARQLALKGQAVFDRIEQLSKPVIAAVNGFCLGGGCELSLACHLRVASENARFGQPEVKLGLIPGYGGTQRLTRLIGRGKALEMILTGDMLTAQEALQVGLVNRVCSSEDLLDECRRLAQSIKSNAPGAVSLSLEAVRLGADMSLSDGLAWEAALFGLSFSTEDAREGTQAFLEKRKPQFQGR